MCASPHIGLRTSTPYTRMYCGCRAQASSTVAWLLQLHMSGWDHITAGVDPPPAASSQPSIPAKATWLHWQQAHAHAWRQQQPARLAASLPHTRLCCSAHNTMMMAARSVHQEQAQGQEDQVATSLPQHSTWLWPPAHGGYEHCNMPAPACRKPQLHTSNTPSIHSHWQGLTCTTRYCDESSRWGPTHCRVLTGPGGSKHIQQQLHFTWDRDLQGARDLEVAGGSPVDRTITSRHVPRPQPTTPLQVRNHLNSKATYSAATGWYRRAAGLCLGCNRMAVHAGFPASNQATACPTAQTMTVQAAAGHGTGAPMLTARSPSDRSQLLIHNTATYEPRTAGLADQRDLRPVHRGSMETTNITQAQWCQLRRHNMYHMQAYYSQGRAYAGDTLLVCWPLLHASGPHTHNSISARQMCRAA